MELKPIKTRKIYEEIIEQIRRLVSEGDLKPGDRLPSERDLAERLQVSRASVREALSALEMMGLLEVRSGEGTYIRQGNIESVIVPLAWALSIEKDTVLELLEVRKMLEVQIVSLAAERASEEDLADIQKALDSMKYDLEAGFLGEESDHQFHYALARAAHNKILLRLMNTISDTMHQTLRTSRIKLFQGVGNPERLYQEHVKIYDYVKVKDVELAKEAMYKHLLGVEKHFLSEY